MMACTAFGSHESGELKESNMIQFESILIHRYRHCVPPGY